RAKTATLPASAVGVSGSEAVRGRRRSTRKIRNYCCDRSHKMNKSLIVLVSLAPLLGMAGSARGDDGKPKAPGQKESPVRAVAVSLPGGEQGIGFDDIVYAPALHQVIVPAAQTGRVYLIDPATRSH